MRVQNLNRDTLVFISTARSLRSPAARARSAMGNHGGTAVFGLGNELCQNTGPFVSTDPPGLPSELQILHDLFQRIRRLMEKAHLLLAQGDLDDACDPVAIDLGG